MREAASPDADRPGCDRHANLRRCYLQKDLATREEINRLQAQTIWALASGNVAIPHKARILEYGCNTGHGIRHLAEMGIECVGVDIRKDAIEFAIEHNSHHNLKFSWSMTRYRS